MNPVEEARAEVSRRTWIAPVAVAVVLAVAAVFMWHNRSALLEARRTAEAEKMRADGLAVEAQASKAALAAHLGEILTKAPPLAAEVAKIKASQPSAEVVEANERSTGAIEAQGAAAPAPPVKPSSPPPPVLLYAHDKFRISVYDVTLRAPQGTDAVAGYARVLRLDPDGREVDLGGGVFSADLTHALELERPPPPGWAFGAVGACSGDGCAVGPHVSFPPVRMPLIGGRLEFAAGVTLFGGGKPFALVTVDYRR